MSITAQSAIKAHIERRVELPVWFKLALISAKRPVLLMPATKPAIIAAMTTRGDERRRNKMSFIDL
jgi:hypothetical protein